MIYLDNAATTAMYPECLDSFKNTELKIFQSIRRLRAVR